MKNNKGITLVALVVTIIVLIILTGISINLTIGDNGIITIAQKAKENIELAKIEEETELNELYTQLETKGSDSGNLPYDAITKLTEFKTAIANAIDEAGGVKPDISADKTIFANNIKEIVKEVTKNATATSEDILEGKTAWVNGEIITGTAKITLGSNYSSVTTEGITTTIGNGATATITMNNGDIVFFHTNFQDATTQITCSGIEYENLSKGGLVVVQAKSSGTLKINASAYTSGWVGGKIPIKM